MNFELSELHVEYTACRSMKLKTLLQTSPTHHVLVRSCSYRKPPRETSQGQKQQPIGALKTYRNCSSSQVNKNKTSFQLNNVHVYICITIMRQYASNMHTICMHTCPNFKRNLLVIEIVVRPLSVKHSPPSVSLSLIPRLSRGKGSLHESYVINV